MTKIADITQDSTDTEDVEEKRVKKFARHMLKTSIFMGSFQEKRFVGPLNAYRDVIKIDDCEGEFIENVLAVKRRCANFYPRHTWIGITDPRTIGAPAGYNLWVSLDQEVFGKYWYEVKGVDFYNNEIRLRLKIVRRVTESKSTENDISASVTGEAFSERMKHSLNEKFNYLLTEIITLANIKEAVVFIFLLLSTLATFLVQAIKYFLDYSLKLIREASGFVKASTPVMIIILRLIMNTINGFYALIAYLLGGRNNSSQNVYHHFVPLQGENYNNYRPGNYKRLGYYNQGYIENPILNKGSGVRITQLD